MSRWSEYPPLRQERCLSEIANQVKDRDMPLWYYTIMHQGTALSETEVAAVFKWTQAERSRLIEENLQTHESGNKQ
jgi:hypothetical protein